MIEVSHLAKELSNDEKIFRAIDGASFQVQKGEIYGIVGLSGTGKSTLARCLNHLEESASGKISVDKVGMVALNRKELLSQRKDIGVISQHFNLFLQKTVYDNIAYPLEIQGWPREKIRTRVGGLLNFVDLKDERGVYPSSLSGRQKQGVAIARVLVTSPKILLSNEGTSALGPINTRVIMKTLKKMVKDLNTTIIMITHQTEVVKDTCDRVTVMENGKIIEENTAKRFFRAPKTRQIQGLISSLGESDDPDQSLDLTKHKGRVLRLSYDDRIVDQPILSRCVRDYQVDINLLSGNMNQLDAKGFSYMVVEALGPDQQIDQALVFTKRVGVYVGILK